MADVKISALPAASTPLAGTELVPIVQSGVTEQVSVTNLTAGRSVAAAALTVDANSATDAVRITQTGAGNALVVEDSTNPDATPFVVDSSGRVGIGTTTTTRPLDVVGTATVEVGLTRYSSNTNEASVQIRKSRGTQSASTVVLSGDICGAVSFWGYDGSAFIRAAQIWSVVDGTPGTNDMPGRLVFSTTADGASSPTERMRITSAGNIVAGGSAALATSATNGFLYVPTCAGTPVGTPTAITGMAPVVVDTTNNKLYFYSGGVWRDAGP